MTEVGVQVFREISIIHIESQSHCSNVNFMGTMCKLIPQLQPLNSNTNSFNSPCSPSLSNLCTVLMIHLQCMI